MDMRTLPRWRRRATAGAIVCVAAAAAGCQSNYAVDIRNETPQPVYADLFARTDNAATRRARVRLGPGDRGAVGPVRARTGTVYLSIDTLPNPGAPATLDLSPGTTIVRVEQEGDRTAGRIRLVEVSP